MTGGSADVAHDAPSRLYFPHLSGLNAQRLGEFVSMRLAPAVTGGALTYSHVQSEWQGVITLVSMLGIVTILRSPRYPLQLIPFASAILYLLAPPLGAAVAMGISAVDGAHTVNLTVGEMIAPVLGAWLVTGLGAWLTHRFRREREVRIAVIGTHEFARSLEAELKAVGVRGYTVVGCIDPEHSCSTENVAGMRCLGSLLLLRHTVLEHGLELLVLGPLSPAAASTESEFQGAGPSRLDVFESVADACLDLPVSMIEAGQFYEQLFGHVPLGTTTSAWFQYLLHPDYRGSWPSSKRLLDLVVGSMAALVAAPILLVAAIAIKLSDGGPILYRQTRVGERGREFELLKLRTMYEHADERLGADEESLVTPVGRVLRRLHVNELPQVWQVLRGEMSLVGPRPERTKIVASLESRFSYYDRRHLLKPGITGWAQVRCGYSGTPIGEAWKLCHDLFYLKRRSILFDLLIILETTSTIIFPEPIKRPDERFIVRAKVDDDLTPAGLEAAASR
jgi:lipopolysaccharide/colanic/teichoic acid biosynthesis glycosyltransferase